MAERTCVIDGCIRKDWYRGDWCVAHYHRWLKYGDPLGGGPTRAIRGTAPKRQPCTEPSGDRRADARYPSDQELVELAQRLGSFTKVAAAVGVRRESLRDFLRHRPELRAAMAEHTWRPMAESDKRAAQERHRQQCRDWQRNKRAADPEGVRRERREYMARKYGPEHRHKWNHYNRLRRKGLAIPDALAIEYAKIIRRDPCVYCGAPCEHIDHIVPIVHGGTGAWDNLAPTCASCNQQKHTKTLLQFMLWRLRAS